LARGNINESQGGGEISRMSEMQRDIKLVNLTPHDIEIYSGGVNATILTRIKKSGTVARVELSEKEMGKINNVPVYARVMSSSVEGLPAPKDGVLYVVSTMILEAERDRTDLLAPDTGPSCIRDSNNRIKGITRFLTRK